MILIIGLRPLKNWGKNMNKEYLKNGYFVYKNKINRILLEKIKYKINKLFSSDKNKENDQFDQNVIELFENDFQKFIGCAHASQNLFELYKLSVSNDIHEILKDCGIKNPNINTKPLLFFSCKSTAKKDKNWKLKAHQDWPSTMGSLNGVSIWIPFQDTSKDLGCLELIPKSHLQGYIKHTLEDIPVLECNEDEFVPIEMNVGDVLVFSWFTIHKSGTNTHSDKIRLSTHFRYNDLSEPTYAQRNYFRNRIDETNFCVDTDFPSLQQIMETFNER